MLGPLFDSGGTFVRDDRVSKLLLTGLAVLAVGVVAVQLIAQSQEASQSASAAWKVDFEKNIRPIFESSCYRCHGPSTQMSGLRLDLKQAALSGGSFPARPWKAPSTSVLQESENW